MSARDVFRPIHLRRLCIVAAVIACVPATGAAQERPDTLPRDTVIPLEGVVVSTVRPATTTGGSSAVMVSPDSLHVVPAPTLEEVMRELPFVSVRENSRGQAEISVRGSESRQVAVLLDGLPLTLGWDHRADPAVIPITGAESITVIRGLHSVLYGPNVLGGVVEIGTAAEQADDAPATRRRATAGLDAYGARSLAVSGRTIRRPLHGDVTVAGGAGYRSRPGVPLPAGTEDPYTDDADVRANSDRELIDAFGAVRYEAADGRWFGVSGSGFRAERGVPPEIHVSDPRLWRYPDEWRVLSTVSLGTGHRRTRWGTGDVEASFGLNTGGQRIESFATAHYEQPVATETGRERTVSMRLLGDHSFAAGGILTGAATFADVRYREDLPDARNRYAQRLWSVASEATLPVLRDGRISAGLAFDGADTPESGAHPPLGTLHAWGGRIGASTLVLDDRVRAHAAVSRRARFPALRELYSGALGRFEPNPDLGPEILVGAETGLTARSGPVEVQLVAFHHRLNGAIVRTATPEGRFRRENRDQIRSDGLEILADGAIGRLRVSGDAVIQNVRVLEPGDENGAHRPEYQPRLRTGLTADLELPARLRALASGRYTSVQHCVDPESGRDVPLPAAGALDLGLLRAWRAGRIPLRTTLSLDNVTDAAVYDQCGLPGPGRTLRLSVEVG